MAPLPNFSFCHSSHTLGLCLSKNQIGLPQPGDQKAKFTNRALLLGQTPYLRLERELFSCYADVALSLPAELQRREAEKPHHSSHGVPHKVHERGLFKVYFWSRICDL